MGRAAGATRAGAAITPDLTVGPDGTFLPAGFTRTTDGGNTTRLLEFDVADLTNPNFVHPTYAPGTPRNDGVTFTIKTRPKTENPPPGGAVPEPVTAATTMAQKVAAALALHAEAGVLPVAPTAPLPPARLPG